MDPHAQRSEPRIVASSEAQTIVGWRCFLIVVVRNKPSVDDVEAMLREVEHLRDGGAAHCGLVHLPQSTPRLDPPPEAVRAVYRRLMNDASTIVRGSAVVVEQEGFFGAVVRSVVTSLSLLARPVYPTRALPDRQTAATWLLEQLASHPQAPAQPPATANELLAAIAASATLASA